MTTRGPTTPAASASKPSITSSPAQSGPQTSSAPIQSLKNSSMKTLRKNLGSTSRKKYSPRLNNTSQNAYPQRKYNSLKLTNRLKNNNKRDRQSAIIQYYKQKRYPCRYRILSYSCCTKHSTLSRYPTSRGGLLTSSYVPFHDILSLFSYLFLSVIFLHDLDMYDCLCFCVYMLDVLLVRVLE